MGPPKVHRFWFLNSDRYPVKNPYFVQKAQIENKLFT